MKAPVRAATAALLAMLSGCVAPVGPVEVTRFHVPEAQTSERGTIAVEPAPGADGASLEFRTYATAVARELSRIGYRDTMAGTESEQVALLSIEHSVAVPEPKRSPVTVGVGGGTGGVGLGVGLDLSGPPPEMVETRMRVMIRERASGKTIWEGRASFSVRASSPLAQASLGAAKMTEALFKDFPGQSGETIYVP